MIKKIKILGVKIDPLSEMEIDQRLEELLAKKSKSQIVTVNPEFVVLAQNNEEFKQVLNQASLRTADGIGILIAGKFLTKTFTLFPVLKELSALIYLKYLLFLAIFRQKSLKNPIPDRVTGVVLTHKLIKLASSQGLKVFLLGGGPSVAEKAALVLQTKFFDLKIAGTYGGSPAINEEEKIIDLINKHKADILLVAYGAPKQDLWLRRNLKKTTAKIGIGIGGTLDFIAGDIKRAPRFFQNHSLEWLYRLILEPRKRFRRQLSLFRFLWLLFWEKCRR